MSDRLGRRRGGRQTLGWELGLGLGPGLSLGADLHPVDPQQPIQQGDRSGPLRFGDHRRGRRLVTGPEPLAGAGACVLTDARLGLAKLVDASFDGKQPRPAGQIARGEGTAGSDVHQRKGHGFFSRRLPPMRVSPRVHLRWEGSQQAGPLV